MDRVNDTVATDRDTMEGIILQQAQLPFARNGGRVPGLLQVTGKGVGLFRLRVIAPSHLSVPERVFA